MSYAERTTVSPDRSRAEVERVLERYGARGFVYGWDGGRAVIGFRAQGRVVRFYLLLPDLDEFAKDGRRSVAPGIAKARYEQEVRRRWRALALTVKAKLEAVQSGITTFEQEFLAHLLLPDGETVAEWIKPQLESVYLSGQMPRTLLGGLVPAEQAPRITARVVEGAD